MQQIGIQWLTDDEWHAIDRIQATDGYAALVKTFGYADYSIPLALLYRLLATTVGLNELAMRLPMLVCGLLTIVLGGLWVWRRLGPRTAVAFTFYLAVSPLLVSYSRNARPYAITLLLAGVAIIALARWDATRSARTAAVYGLATWSAVWLHLTSGPLLLAPLVWVFCKDTRRAFAHGDWRRVRSSLALGVALAAALAVVIAPPLLLDPQALGGKIGQHTVDLDTLIGALHIVAGSASPLVVVGMGALALVGAGAMWRALKPEITLALVGLATTLALLLATRPMWLNHAVVLVRYVLPVVPLALLAAACGAVRVFDAIANRSLRAAFAVVATAGTLVGSPHAELLRRPNNFTLHSYYQFDYRNSPNGTREYVDRIPTSPYWATLGRLPPDTLRIAIAGHGFESYYIGDVRWQPIHRQRLFNAQLSMYCTPPLPGEALPGSGIRLANAVTLAEPGWMDRAHIDLLAWKKLNRYTAPAYADLAPCLGRMRLQFGVPVYEDDELVVFDTHPQPR